MTWTITVRCDHPMCNITAYQAKENELPQSARICVTAPTSLEALRQVSEKLKDWQFKSDTRQWNCGRHR